MSRCSVAMRADTNGYHRDIMRHFVIILLQNREISDQFGISNQLVKMRVQWKRKQIFIAVAMAVFLSTLGLIKYTREYELQGLRKYVKERMSESNGNTFKLYGEETTGSTMSSKNKLPTLKKKIKKFGIYQRNQTLQGSMLDKRGVVGDVTSNISTELVFSFSPTAEEKFSEKLVDPNHEQKVYANSPAMIWDGEKFIVVMRMWLDKEHTAGKTKNVFSDNYLYMRIYNEKMQALDVSGRILGIPTRVLESIGK